jgi:glycosyltransferase involved in cell wall biosynthesis
MYKNIDKYYVNINTSTFLEEIVHDVNYIEIVKPLKKHGDINDCECRNVEVTELSSTDLLSSLRVLWSAVKKGDYVYVFYPGRLPFIGVLFALLLRKPFGLYVRGEILKRNLMTGLFLRYSERIIAVSEGLVPERYSRKLKICHPMLTLGWKEYEAKNSNEYIKFLFVGRVETAKGIFELLEFFIQYIDGGEGCLTIVGDGDSLVDVKKFISDRNLQSLVKFKGVLTGGMLQEEYKNADVFLLFSHTEGFPRVLYEATFNSCLVITTDVGGVSSVFCNGENCLFVTDQLLSQFKNLSAQAKRIMIENARNDIHTRLNTYYKKHSELINELSI